MAVSDVKLVMSRQMRKLRLYFIYIFIFFPRPPLPMDNNIDTHSTPIRLTCFKKTNIFLADYGTAPPTTNSTQHSPAQKYQPSFHAIQINVPPPSPFFKFFDFFCCCCCSFVLFCF
ncbi:hypothetical protein, unlikely [Trypanosoma brucei gambiense DAL972]|uniref:Uncharacterized protein n=1 Tax=Trypanosoma brucei gambiense (strain MHOM/CI/86/DAL972) TaxID=679716 RepID=C9ZJ52_TRYB9|nr:hypothetical protein, unlikely [Trypanosoma brucei gambiense DAL972]CBH09410.1 hypothetical protein, unlikely [Trypanosoma brucei gambiense DAL972]|eukprot:XP_011771716.1 hypothetical protein, unlikely [Trypanosoma brucei gambiense DAL972]